MYPSMLVKQTLEELWGQQDLAVVQEMEHADSLTPDYVVRSPYSDRKISTSTCSVMTACSKHIKPRHVKTGRTEECP
jgi:hypothetical protein